MASGSIVTNSYNHPTAKDQSSVAASSPFELVEAILLQLTVPELLIAAANVPRYWRSMIETNPNIVQKLHRYPYLDGSLSIMTVVHSTTFSYPIRNGTLFLHRDRLGNEGIVFASRADKLTIKVLKTREKIPFQPLGVHSERFSYKIYNFDGKLMCTRVWSTDGRSVLWQYVAARTGIEDLYEYR